MDIPKLFKSIFSFLQNTIILFHTLSPFFQQMFVSSHRLTKNKIRPLEEPRHVVLQPILRPAVAGVGVIQPQLEIRNHHVVAAAMAADTDSSENTPSPSRSPMRRGRGLLERWVDFYIYWVLSLICNSCIFNLEFFSFKF